MDTHQLVSMFANIDHWGEAHIVFEDLNVDEHNLTELANNPRATEKERHAASVLLAMDEDHREPFLKICELF